jgi:Fe-S cluster biosynthesis and repair protein YggX
MLQKNNPVSIQGIVNTTDLEKVMNLYTSSFTTSFNEGFIKMLEFQLSKSPQQFPPISKVKKRGKQKTIRSSSLKLFNEGFEKLKNPTLRGELQICQSVKFDKTKHVTVSELGFKTIYDLDKRSNKMWKDYFSKSKVYLNKDVNTSKISQRILFDKSIKKYLIKSNSVTKVVTESNLD